ncbi:uncharacterized protein LOC143855786 [Tasmannia lanceolata]|uniref:uncharacterized protein LOC143855786 n=1 Tax=Tasmannia lanceolata TaxID=3420 RepID=UPI004063E587
MGHYSNQCTKPRAVGGGRRQQQQPTRQARTFAITIDEVEATNDVVIGTLSISSKNAHTLFDSGSTHSFVSPKFAKHLNIPLQKLDLELSVKIPGGNSLITSGVYRACSVDICGRNLSVDLISLPILDFDVILGMDWLTLNHANIDYYKKEVRTPTDQQLEFSIKLVPGATPLSKRTYRMAPIELEELKKQLQELEDLFHSS